MRKAFLKLGAVLLCGAMLCGCGKTAGYPRETHTNENLKASYTYVDEEGKAQYDYYYGYSATGELMFTVKEYAYEASGISGVASANWYTKDTLQSASYVYPRESFLLTVDTVYDSSKMESRRDTLLLAKGTLQYLTMKTFTYSEDKLTSTDTTQNFTTTAQSAVLTSHSAYNKDGKLVEAYDADGNGKEYLMEKLEYTDEGNVSKIYSYSYEDDKTILTITEYTYDKKGNVQTLKTYVEGTGELSSSYTYSYDYNSNGTINGMITKNELTGKSTATSYGYIKVSETSFDEAYVGYWQCKNDAESYFLEVSCNGLICVGNFDPTFGVMTPQVYGFYKIQSDGKMVCELYENGTTSVEEYLQGIIYLEKGKLIFNELKFEKVD